jgi:hypothetical protein
MTILTMLSLTHLASFDAVPSQDAGRVQELVGSLGQDEIRVYFSPNLESGQTLVGGSRC